MILCNLELALKIVMKLKKTIHFFFRKKTYYLSQNQ